MEVLDIPLRHYVTPPPAEDMQWHFLFCDTVFCTGMTEGIITLPQSLPSREGSLKEGLDLP